MVAELFQRLDLDRDGFISRSELNTAAKRFGWSWREAPVFAALDFLSISGPISKSEFIAYFDQMGNDPLGPYGKVLRNSPLFSQAAPLRKNRVSHQETMAPNENKYTNRMRADTGFDSTTELLAHTAGIDIAANYQAFLDTLETCHIPTEDSALLIIDPQRSFTQGAWMQSMGNGAEVDVAHKKPVGLSWRTVK